MVEKLRARTIPQMTLEVARLRRLERVPAAEGVKVANEVDIHHYCRILRHSADTRRKWREKQDLTETEQALVQLHRMLNDAELELQSLSARIQDILR